MKKVLLIIFILAIIGAGTYGTLNFYNKYKNEIKQVETLTQNNATIQASLNAIGAMTNVYQVASKTYSGNPVKDSDLISVSVPVSSLGETSITDKSELVGKFYKIDVNPGTNLTRDLLMNEVTEVMRYTRDINLKYLPVTTLVGDYIDIRMMLPTGEDYPVLAHKRIKLISNQTITIDMSEEELQIWNAALIDYAVYNSAGLVLYVTKYLYPGLDTDTVAFWPVQRDMENHVRFNVNIEDKTRCINSTLRDHIDQILFLASTSDNISTSSTIGGMFSSEAGMIVAAQENWLVSVTDDEGNITVNNGDYSNPSFDQNIGNSMNNLENDLGSLLDEDAIN